MNKILRKTMIKIVLLSAALAMVPSIYLLLRKEICAQKAFEVLDLSKAVFNDCQIDANGKVRIEGNDPYFIVRLPIDNPRTISFQTEQEAWTVNTLKVYYDTGKGFQESETLLFENGKFSSVQKFPRHANILQLRIDFENFNDSNAFSIQKIWVNYDFSVGIDLKTVLLLAAMNFVLFLIGQFIARSLKKGKFLYDLGLAIILYLCSGGIIILRNSVFLILFETAVICLLFGNYYLVKEMVIGCDGKKEELLES